MLFFLGLVLSCAHEFRPFRINGDGNEVLLAYSQWHNRTLFDTGALC